MVRGWDQAELSKRSRLDSGLISRLVTGERHASVNVCIALASALRLSREEVFTARGWLKQLPEGDLPVDTDPLLLELVRRVQAWSPDMLEIVVPLLIAVVDGVEQAHNTSKNR